MSTHNSRDKKKTPNSFYTEKSPQIFLSLSIFIGLLITLGILLWQLPKISSYNLGAPTFIVYVLISLLASIVTFGILRGYGNLRGHLFGLAVEFGGASAMFLVVLFAGTQFEENSTDVFELTIYFHEAGNNSKLIEIQGTAVLMLDEPKTVSFVGRHVIFSKINATHLDKVINLSIDIKGRKYEAVIPTNNKFSRSKIMYIPLKKNSYHKVNSSYTKHQQTTNYSSNPSERMSLKVTLDISPEDLASPLFHRIIKQLQNQGNDVSLRLLRIEEGSTILVLECSTSGCNRINTLFYNGNLNELLGISVLNIQLLEVEQINEPYTGIIINYSRKGCMFKLSGADYNRFIFLSPGERVELGLPDQGNYTAILHSNESHLSHNFIVKEGDLKNFENKSWHWFLFTHESNNGGS